MKKTIIILVSFIYLFLSTGLVINVHFCQDKVKSISIITEPANCCPTGCVMESSCCKNKQFIVQMEYEDQILPLTSEIPASFVFILQPEYHVNVKKIDIPNPIFANYNLPPPKLPIWKTNCTFIFYG